MSVQERVFTRLDQGSVRGGSSDAGSSAHVQDQRMRWNTSEWYIYAQDLQKVTVMDDDLFRVEKIVKCKGDKVLVRWKGWPDKYDS